MQLAMFINRTWRFNGQGDILKTETNISEIFKVSMLTAQGYLSLASLFFFGVSSEHFFTLKHLKLYLLWGF